MDVGCHHDIHVHMYFIIIIILCIIYKVCRGQDPSAWPQYMHMYYRNKLYISCAHARHNSCTAMNPYYYFTNVTTWAQVRAVEVAHSMIRRNQKAWLIEVLMTFIKCLEAAGGVSTFIGNAKSQIEAECLWGGMTPIVWADYLEVWSYHTIAFTNSSLRVQMFYRCSYKFS